jgi:hypothetical protein
MFSMIFNLLRKMCWYLLDCGPLDLDRMKHDSSDALLLPALVRLIFRNWDF